MSDCNACFVVHIAYGQKTVSVSRGFCHSGKHVVIRLSVNVLCVRSPVTAVSLVFTINFSVYFSRCIVAN